jgi:hypothetical protein
VELSTGGPELGGGRCHVNADVLSPPFGVLNSGQFIRIDYHVMFSGFPLDEFYATAAPFNPSNVGLSALVLLGNDPDLAAHTISNLAGRVFIRSTNPLGRFPTTVDEARSALEPEIADRLYQLQMTSSVP